LGLGEQSERDSLLLRVTDEGRSLSTVVYFLGFVEHTTGRHPVLDSKKLEIFSKDGIEKAKNILLARIRTEAEKGTVLDLPDPMNIVFRWRDWAGKDEVTIKLNSYLNTSEGLLKLMKAFSSEIKSVGGDDTEIVRIRTEIRLKYLQEFFDVPALKQKVAQLKNSQDIKLSDDEINLINGFLSGESLDF